MNIVKIKELSLKRPVLNKLLCLSLILIMNGVIVDSLLAQIRPRYRNPIYTTVVPRDTDGAEFYFTRLIYGSDGFRSRGGWMTDMPEADHYFMNGLTRLTRVDGSLVDLRNPQEGAPWINLQDGSVFDYPFLYAVEVGGWRLNVKEIAILREYLLIKIYKDLDALGIIANNNTKKKAPKNGAFSLNVISFTSCQAFHHPCQALQVQNFLVI